MKRRATSIPISNSPPNAKTLYWWNGWGWYRKRIVISEELRGKRIFVELDGVQKYARVYLNGTLLGDHKGGYNGFYFDLTPHIRFGRGKPAGRAGVEPPRRQIRHHSARYGRKFQCLRRHLP